ncbi:LysR substrate-binding domain-containing protein [uncultured Jannaschia sp.]|uniref:LysR substrate-binding domain-containing protein n=1 Tax=uncultured Jannaschia sp. TaxID=293347 RepID=UPI00260862AE|nr:LysR substrate-binding domain-containing protein [uncultured Jannaschia sp.]
MTDLPPLNALRAFDASGRHLTFRAAAEELGVTQGAVAQHVRALEAHLGLPLFTRLPKGLALTPAGRGYHGRIATAFADLRAATGALHPKAGVVVVSVPPTFAAKWLIPNLPSFSEANPEIELRVLATQAVSSFHGDGIDLAVRQGPPPMGAALEVVRLFGGEVVAVCAPQLFGKAPLPMNSGALARLPRLHDAHDLWPTFLRHIGASEDTGRGTRFSQTSLAIDAASAGQGAALVSRFLVAREIAAGLLVEVSAEAMPGPHDFHLVARRRNDRSHAAKAVFQWFRSMAEPST